MTSRMNRIPSCLALCLALAGCVLLAICNVAAGEAQHGIPNFAQVEPGLWRGGQPGEEGWKYLASLGVKQAIKLNTEKESSDSGAKSNGIAVIAYPITLAEQTVGKPSTNTLHNAVSALNTNGVFVHCEHGQDRTGLIIGAYRVRTLGWSKAAAYQEMKAHGFHSSLLGLSKAWKEDIQ